MLRMLDSALIDVTRFQDQMRDGAALHRERYRKAILPPPALTIAQWSDKYRRLSGVASAEEGRWRTSRTPYLQEIMECLSPSSPVQWVVFRKAAQVGATETGNNWVGYFVDQLGGAMLCVQPTVEMAKRWSKQRLAPLLRDTPRLAGKVQESRSRDSGNTLMSKEFAGGIILVTGANSAVGLRSMPAQWLNFDEVDAYPDVVDEEGHPVDVAWFRSATFPFRKVLEVSTPKVRHASRIDADIARSDPAHYFVPCPECGGFQRLSADRLIYAEENPVDCDGMACLHCGVIIAEGKKTQMLAAGEWWRPGAEPNAWTKRPVRGLMAGFSLSQLYSPIGLGLTWGEVAKHREASKTDDNAARTYRNLVLGESYEEKSDAPQWERLYELRENYKMGQLPAGAFMLVGSADIQRDRIEVAYHAFGPDFEAWYIDHTVLDGNTSQDEVWPALTEARKRKFPHASGPGEFPVDLFLVDMQYETEAVKLWVRRQRSPRRVRAIQGSESWGAPAVIGRSQTDITNTGDKKAKRRGFHFWRISTASLKTELYRRLRREVPDKAVSPYGGPWVHHPQVNEEWMKQLTAERIVRRKTLGRSRSRLSFEKTRDRNEGLDLTVYNFAGAYMLKAEQLSPSEWAKYRDRWGTKLADTASIADDSSVGKPPGRTPTPRSSVRRKNWVTSY